MMLETHVWLDSYDELPFRRKWRRVLHGLSQPRESGDFKYAKLQIQRLGAPLAALLLPLLLVALLLTVKTVTPPHKELPVELRLPVEAPALDDVIEKPKPPDPEPGDQAPAFTEAPFAESPDTAAAAVSAERAFAFSPQPMALDAVARVPSSIVFRPLIGGRSSGERDGVLAGTEHGQPTARAVYLALRWLKKYQSADGSWEPAAGGGPGGGATAAFTGLGLLTLLAHGEKPGSEEFGPTVERAIKWLLANQTAGGDFNKSDGNNYSQPIATYALCETFALTRIPMVKEAAERSVARIVKGQNPKGFLWNYNFDAKSHLGPNAAGERNDLSFAGWCMQALKAAGTAGIRVEGLELATKHAGEGVRRQARAGADGTIGFGYTSPAQDNITTAGALCLQLLGAGKSREVSGALSWLKRADCDWAKPWTENPLYHWYYVTQVKFHAGGAMWEEWNRQFWPALTRNQTIVPNAMEDANGNLVDIGYWKPAGPNEHCQSYVYNTTLCALMLQVYYRNLPTYKTPGLVADEPATLEDRKKDVDIVIL